MMKLRSCICPTITPGSNTRDFSSAKPNVMPIATPIRTAVKSDIGIFLR